MDLVKNNKINFKKYINYDPISMVILDLPIVLYDKDEYSLSYSDLKKIKHPLLRH